MKPIQYDEFQMMNITLISDLDNTEYSGEYIDMRIDKDTIPSGKYAYDCRHDDNGDWVTPVTIENHIVVVNFAGTFITNEPIVFPPSQDYIPVSSSDF